MWERLIERGIYSARWILAPVYLGLSLALLALGIKFFQEVLHVLPAILEIKEADLVLLVLSLIAISSIHLLKIFMNTPNVDNDKLLWYVIIHLTFVVSAFGKGMLDRMTRQEVAAPQGV